MLKSEYKLRFKIYIEYGTKKAYGVQGHHHILTLKDISEGAIIEILNCYKKFKPELKSIEVIKPT